MKPTKPLNSFVELSSDEAWDNLLKHNEFSRWFVPTGAKGWQRSAANRLSERTFLPHLLPRFKISRSESIFCIGSCFARHVEHELAGQGFSILSRPADSAGELACNKYNTHSMLNDLKWGLEPGASFPENGIVYDGEQFNDLQSHGGISKGDKDSVLAERNAVINLMRRASECRTIILTLGLVEAWYDSESHLYLNSTPPLRVAKQYPNRFHLHVLSYNENLKVLEEIHDLLSKYGHPDFQMIVTVSPVPFQTTFTQQDVVVANSYSKSTLRAVAGDFARLHANVDYLPTYESVTNSQQKVTWEEDRIHVTPAIVQLNIMNFIANYVDEESISNMARQALEDRAGGINASDSWTEDLAPPDFENLLPKEERLMLPAGRPRVTASSSQWPHLGPENLSYGRETIWHAQIPPRFPEWIEISFSSDYRPTSLWMQSQYRHPERTPSTFVVEAKSDNAQWELLLSVENAIWEHGGQWKQWSLSIDQPYRLFRLTVYSSSTTEYLTLLRLWLAP